jgi:hypothetical protein
MLNTKFMTDCCELLASARGTGAAKLPLMQVRNREPTQYRQATI